MAERDDLVAALVAEVLGPRRGVRERLESLPHRPGETVTPLEEYITGVLAPRDAQADEEIDAYDDLLGEHDESADDQEDTGAPAVLPGVTPTSGPGCSPSLDPRSRPCSIGLSILVQGEQPVIDICATWAWYEQAGQIAWQREPRYELWTGINCTRDRLRREISEPDGVRKVTLEIRCKNAPNGQRVSIFLVNTTQIERAGPEHHVYQPQIRIQVKAGTQLIPIDDDPTLGDQEGASLSLLYANRRALARGHLCGAIWHDVDPERSFSGPRPPAPPFTWLDGSLLPQGVAAGFSPAAARTELVPSYLILAPSLAASELHGQAIFNPDQLCELWDPTALGAALRPLTDAYESWMGAFEKRGHDDIVT